MLAAKRMREHLALFVSLCGVAAIVAGLTAGLSAYLGAAATDGVRAGLAAATGSDAALRASFALESDADAQDATVRRGLASVLARDGRPVPFTITRSVGASTRFPIGEPGVAVPAEPSPELPTAIARSIADLPDVATIVDGDWPTSPDEVTVQADGAERLGLAVGDRIRFGTIDVTVSGTWRVDDPLAGRWMGETLLTDGAGGSDDRDVGPVIIDESRWPELDAAPRGSWTLTPRLDAIEADDLAVVLTSWQRMSAELRDRGFETGSLSLDGRMLRTATELDGRVAAVRAVQPGATLVILAIGVVTLLELARLLVGLRAGEIVLVRSRGATAGRVALTTALETAVVAGVGALLGTAAAVGVLAAVVGGLPRALEATGVLLIAAPLLTALAASAITGLTALRSARAALRRDTLDDSGRGRTVASLGGVALLTIAAIVSMSQFLLYGSPVTPVTGGGTAIDPVTVLAPALALIAIVLLGLALLPLPARAVDRATARRGGIRVAMTARTLSRRIRLTATPIVLAALCIGQLLVAAGYGGTWSESFAQTRQLRIGGPIAVSAPFDGLGATQLDAVRETAAVTAVAPVGLEATTVAGEYVSVVAATPTTTRTLANDGLGAIDPDAAADLIDSRQDWPQLPEDATGVRLELTITGFAAPPDVAVVLVDRYGALTPVALEVADQDTAADGAADGAAAIDPLEPTTVSWLAEVPPTAGGLRLAAIDVDLPAVTAGPIGATVVVEGIAAEAANGEQSVDQPDSWRAGSLTLGTQAEPVATGVGFSTDLDDFPYLVRLQPLANDESAGLTSVIAPALVSRSIADRYNVDVGSILPVDAVGGPEPLQAVVAGVIEAVPSADSSTAILVDLDAVTALRLRSVAAPGPVEYVWVGSDDPAVTVAALRDRLPAGVRVTAVAVDPSDAVLRSASVALWIGAAGTALLAFVAIGAVVGAQLRFRSAEVVVLRAIGLGARDQAAIRRGELGATLAAGAVLGTVAGVVVSVLTTAALARAAVPRPIATLPTVLRFDPPVIAVALLAVVVVLVGMLIAYGAGVAAQARRLSAREDVR